MTAGMTCSVLSGLGVFLIAHLVLWRARASNAPRLGLLAWLAMIGVAVSIIVQGTLEWGDALQLTSVIWIDLLGIIAYLFVYAKIVRSVSLTLLAQLARDGETVTFEALARDYLASAKFEDRIRLMEAHRFVRCENGAVRITPRGVRLARWASRVGALIGPGLQG